MSDIRPVATPDDLFARLRALGIETQTIHHPAVFTVADAKQRRGPIQGGHCKSLFLRDKKKRSWLVVALEDTRIDMKMLSDRLGAPRLSFGSAERLARTLGVAPGSVTPFALINDPDVTVTVVLDAAMMAVSPVNYHPLHNTMTTAITPADLLTFIHACGHTPDIVDLSGMASDPPGIVPAPS